MKERVKIFQMVSPTDNCYFILEIITCDPCIYTMDHSKFIVSNQKEESISAEMVNGVTHYLIERPFNYFASGTDPDQAALVRAA